MAIEIRKLPKWEEANINDKLDILKEYNQGDSYLLTSIIVIMLGAFKYSYKIMKVK